MGTYCTGSASIKRVSSATEKHFDAQGRVVRTVDATGAQEPTRDQGGTFVRDKDTGELVDISTVETEVRKKQ